MPRRRGSRRSRRSATVALKGFAAPEPLWRVEVAAPTPAVPDLPLAGRDAERAQLAAVIGAAIAGTGQLVLLRGEPGIGKSRLVAEALEIARMRAMHGVRAQVLDFGVERGTDAAGTIARALLDRAPQAEADHVVALDDLLGRERDAAGTSIWNAMTPAAREQARQRALAALATAAAAREPLLIAVEDLHWAEPGQLAILAALAAAARGQRIALLFTTRFDGDPIDRAWRAKAGAIPFTAIELAPLSDAEAMRLAQTIGPDSGGTAREWIARAEGNPLFLIELARHAAEIAGSSFPTPCRASSKPASIA